MGARSGARRLADFGRALRMGRRELVATGGLAPEELRGLQQQRLDELVQYAVGRSPFYRELYRGVDTERVDLSTLPPVSKAQLMDRFDHWVTDRRLRLTDVERHIEGLAGDELHLGQYRVVATSGSTGHRGVFVYSRPEWVVNLANFDRATEQFLGVHPRLPPRLRAALVGATNPLHVSARTSITAAVGVNRVLRLDARLPLLELATALQRFQPEYLIGYPSVLALLADEQRAGRLHLRPTTVTTMAEVRTPEMEEAIRTAWSVEPFNWYGISEGGVLAVDCNHHRGMHLFEDLFLVENVDEDGHPVPDGVVGHTLLLTNLFNRTQPTIRYQLSDMLTLDSAPCPCGRPFRRVTSIQGRSDDILRLPARAGGEVAIHPFTLRSPFTRLPDVRQYKVVYDLDGVRVLVVPREGGSGEGLADRVHDALATTLAGAGARPPAIRVEVVETLAREQGHAGKFKLIESRPGSTVLAPDASRGP
ncbi:MAG: hypothetical protein M3N68_08500 [Actinomycetota bacterium]|nr:hypothetical protein [Actinomycetota bacterium]